MYSVASLFTTTSSPLTSAKDKATSFLTLPAKLEL